VCPWIFANHWLNIFIFDKFQLPLSSRRVWLYKRLKLIAQKERSAWVFDSTRQKGVVGPQKPESIQWRAGKVVGNLFSETP
jgi:hypothetical protein